MANNTYPMLSAKNWWSLRKKFKQTIPGVVTSNYLASVLDMQEVSASNNIMPYIKQIGIVDQDGKTGERAKLWRDDQAYPDVCEAIRKEIYPQELLDIPVETNDDKDIVKRWFSRDTGAGESAVGRMITFYFILCAKDSAQETITGKPLVKPNNTKVKQSSKPKNAVGTSDTLAQTTTSSKTEEHNQPSHASIPSTPAININLQIHISSDASPEQIDKIFESMSKHIYHKDN